MKFLILLLSLILICSSGCGNSESDSTGNSNENDEATDGSPNPTGAPASGSSLTDDLPQPEIPGQPSNLCTKTCVTDAECGEKYNTCLRPKAGDPATTNTNVCTNNNGTPPKITLVVNEWDVPPGQNKLLCDFIEDETILYKFATVKKEACRNDMEARKAELAMLSYNCGTPASMSIPATTATATEADTDTATPPTPARSTAITPLAPARSTAITPLAPARSTATAPKPTATAGATTVPEPAAAERDICAEPCGNTTQCRAKHKNCLRPKAGDPATTETKVCTKDGEQNITFELNEWNSSVGQTNTLLCDLIENGEVLRFATVQKDSCQLRLKERQAELTNESYTCQPQ